MTLKEISSAYGVDAKLLKQYFQAFSNLYGICSLQKAMQIFNLQNAEQRITREQILGFADNYAGNWKIVSPDHVYANVPPTKPMFREIVSKELVYYNYYDGYDHVCRYQADKNFYVPEKNTLLKYADMQYYEQNSYTDAMAQFLEKKLHLPDWQQMMHSILWNLRLDDMSLQDYVDTIADALPNFRTTEEATAIFVNLHNNARMMTNRGYTPNEISRNNQHALPNSISFGPGIQNRIRNGEINADALIKGFHAMNIPQELKESLVVETDKVQQPKPGRNDLCPCGSGKKYKKCCGRK